MVSIYLSAKEWAPPQPIGFGEDFSESHAKTCGFWNQSRYGSL